jgi:glycosyltransferase involved in cell wall biosynthesis
MRLLNLTPGTGNFYCGSCLRDAALMRALRRRGHDVTTVPLYLPLVTEDDEPAAPIFFGGIHAYLEQKFPGIRRLPAWLNSPGLLRFAAGFANLTSAADHGAMTVSMLQGEHGRQAVELEKLIVWLRTQPKPDVIHLSNSLLLGLARQLKAEFRAPVVCSLQGEDGFLDSLPEPFRSESWRLLRDRAADISLFIAPSRYYAQRMKLEPVTVIHNGIVTQDFPAAAPTAPTLGYLARLHPAKGLDQFTDAAAGLKCRVHIAGAMTRADAAFVRHQRAKLPGAEWWPNLPRAGKIAFLRSLSVFSVPAPEGEAFGLYVLEALACGVPVVQPRHGAFPEIIEETGGGLLFEPGGLRAAVESLLADPVQARQLGQAGAAAVREKFSIERMAQNVENVLHGL